MFEEMEFSIGIGRDETAEAAFLKNIRFAEFWHRQQLRDLRKPSEAKLRVRLTELFEQLPSSAIAEITDDLPSLISECVATRNKLVHADVDLARGAATTPARMEVLAMKIGIMLMFQWVLTDYGDEAVKKMVGDGSPVLRALLSQSDKPAYSPQTCLF